MIVITRHKGTLVDLAPLFEISAAN